jgi:CheY-like chemotaxis protein
VILHVEDDDATARLVLTALQSDDPRPMVFRVAEAEAASRFLNKQPPFADVPTPDMVLLDLNLPGKNGFDLLEETRNEPHLKTVCFVVFSTSSLDEDRQQSLDRGAAAFLTKPVSLDDLVAALRSACDLMIGNAHA